MHLITINMMEYIVYSSTPNIFGWLSCDYSLMGGRLRPRRDLLSIIFCHPNHLPNPNGEVTPPHVLHPPHATSPISLPRTSTFGWFVFHLRSSHLRPSHHFLLIFDVCCFAPSKHANHQTTGAWHGTIGGHGTMHCGLHWPTHEDRGQSRWEVGRQWLILVVLCFVFCVVVTSATFSYGTNETFFVESQYRIGQNGPIFFTLIDKNASQNPPNVKSMPKSSWSEDFVNALTLWNGKVLFAVKACKKCA